jgi:hypothetical protein
MPDWFNYVVDGIRITNYGEAGNNASEAVMAGLTVVTGDLNAASGVLDTSNSATVTQSTNKTTGVTANANSGQITTDNAALASNAQVTFTVSNSNVESTDVIVINHATTGYWIQAHNIRNGAFDIIIRNNSGGSLSDAVVFRFVVISKN